MLPKTQKGKAIISGRRRQVPEIRLPLCKKL
jgi:hypothetical protein